jgi:hypothetical protein
VQRFGLASGKTRLWILGVLVIVTGVFTAGPVLSGAVSASTPSVQNAYSFLNQMMDLYAQGSTPRLVQSFTGGTLGRQGFTDSETYDDALMIDAFLGEGTPDGLARAMTLGNSLLIVQSHDPAHDGRIRVAYAPAPLVTTTGRHGHLRTKVRVRVRDKTSDVGNMAWVGMALTRLYAATGNTSYLTGAESVGAWVVRNSFDSRGAGGFTGGRSASGARIKWKSTEHNIDLYGLFTMLASESGNTQWTNDAAWARAFVAGMWNASTGSFYVGTTSDGVTPNMAEQPEDVNSWSYLALQDPAYSSSIDWDVQHLSVSAGGFSGASFCQGDKSGVWFEGTAHLADALELRHASGDATLASQYVSDVQFAQTNGPNGDGLGVIAASKDFLSDCDGGYYYSSLHTGATSWYILASQQVNPFVI